MAKSYYSEEELSKLGGVSHSEEEWAKLYGLSPTEEKKDAVTRALEEGRKSGYFRKDAPLIDKIKAFGLLMKEYGISLKDALSHDIGVMGKSMRGQATPEQTSASFLRSYSLPTSGGSLSMAGKTVAPNVMRTGASKELKAPWKAADDAARKADSPPDYRMQHTSPDPEWGAPLHDVTGGGEFFPSDIYGPKGLQYYGTGMPKADAESYNAIMAAKGNPDATVKIYRAVPDDASITDINAGDWVTLSKDYARQHGESNLPEGYKIIEQNVNARDLWTNADSINEFGYHPISDN